MGHVYRFDDIGGMTDPGIQASTLIYLRSINSDHAADAISLGNEVL